MKITEEHMDFVQDCINKAAPEGDGKLRVDVSLLVERFNLPWPRARELFQKTARKLGYSMAGPRSSLIYKTPRREPKRGRQVEKKSRVERILSAVSALIRQIDEEDGRKPSEK